MAAPAAAVTLYDASQNTVASQQGWMLGTTSGGTPGTEAVSGGVYVLDTTAASVAYGNARISPVTLNTASGFELSFSLRVQSETHNSDNQRAGYSVIVVGNDPTRAVELAFWAGNIWAYDYVAGASDPFQHGSTDVAFNTTAALRNYTLAVSSQQFTLSTGGQTLLSGALRNYTPSANATNPYGVPNALFFGDDTSRGSSITQLGLVLVTAVPEPAPAALLLAGLGLLAWRRRSAACSSLPGD